MPSVQCSICGHWFSNAEERSRHLDRDHAVGLDAFGVNL